MNLSEGNYLLFALCQLEHVENGKPKQQLAFYQATVKIDTDAKAYNPLIFGGFLEHFGKQIYGGVFDPGSPLADFMRFAHQIKFKE